MTTPATTLEALWLNKIQRDCILECNGDLAAAWEAAKYIVAMQPMPKEFALSTATEADQTQSVMLGHDIHNQAAQQVLERSLKAARGLSVKAKRDLTNALNQPNTGEALLEFVDRYRLQLARVLTYTQLAALLEGAQEVATKIPTVATHTGAVPLPPSLEPQEAAALLERLAGTSDAVERAAIIADLPSEHQEYARQAIIAKEAHRGTPPPRWAPPAPAAGSPEDVHFPTIEAAVKNLAERNVMTREQYDKLDANARAKAFTVAGVQAQETLTKIRDSLSENVAKGADHETWRKAVLQDVDKGTFLSDAHQETILRTNVQTAFSDGQESVLAHPMVRSAFPYREKNAIHDDRARENHLALERCGIDGTNVYRADDPVWQLFRSPWDYNCRCNDNPLTVRQAAAAGVKEARQWLETGVEPAEKAFVQMPPFEPPAGFRRTLSAAPLSIQLSLQPMTAFSTDATGHEHDRNGQFTHKHGGADPVILKAAVRSWMADSLDFDIHFKDIAAGIPGTGSMRKRAEELIKAVEAAPLNSVPLYRGDNEDPKGIQSWTSLKSVAEAWAKKGGGKVIELPVGTAKALSFEEFGFNDVEKHYLVNTINTSSALSTDATGHQHKGKGAGGGQFTKGGNSGSGTESRNSRGDQNRSNTSDSNAELPSDLMSELPEGLIKKPGMLARLTHMVNVAKAKLYPLIVKIGDIAPDVIPNTFDHSRNALFRTTVPGVPVNDIALGLSKVIAWAWMKAKNRSKVNVAAAMAIEDAQNHIQAILKLTRVMYEMMGLKNTPLPTRRQIAKSLRNKKRKEYKAFAALSMDKDEGSEKRTKLIAEILVLMFGDDAEGVADELVNGDDTGEDSDFSLSTDESGHEHKGKGAGGGQFTSGHSGPSVGDKYTINGANYEISGFGLTEKRGPNKGRAKVILKKTDGGERTVKFVDELPNQNKKTPTTPTGAKPVEGKSKALLEVYPDMPPALAEKLVDQQIKLANELRKRKNLPPLKFALQLLPIEAITPSQTGEDYDNESSRYTANHIASFNEDERAEDYAPVAVDENDKIIDGNHRHAARVMAGVKTIPALVPVDDDDVPLSIMLAVPKVTRRYGRRPGPSWVPGGFSARGQQIWLWRAPSTGATPAPSPTPPPPTPAPTPAPAPAAATPPAPTPAPAPAASTPTPGNIVVPPVGVGLTGGRRAKAVSTAWGNAAVAKLNAGHALTAADKAALATKLTNMPTPILMSLHTALGGTGAVGNARAAVAAVRAILTSTTPPAPPPAPVAPPAPTPAATPGVNTPTPGNPTGAATAAMLALSSSLHHTAARMRAVAIAYNDKLITKAQADSEMSAIANTVYPSDRRLIVDALTGTTGATTSDAIYTAVAAKDPGHIGAALQIPPKAGLVWDAATNRWAKAPASTPPAPAPAPAPPAKLSPITSSPAAQANTDNAASPRTPAAPTPAAPTTVPVPAPHTATGGPPGPPPRPGLVWNPTTHRWIRPGVYEPPPPKLAGIKAYEDPSVSNSSSGGPIPSTIDHNTVKNYSDIPSSLTASGFTVVPNTPFTVMNPYQYTHSSGYKVSAAWIGGVPATGMNGSYQIDVFDPSGVHISKYTSNAPRDAHYVEKRAVQVANWLDSKIKRLASVPAGAIPTLAQFAADYARPGVVPFKLGDSEWGSAANRAAVDGFLKATYPKLIGARQHAPHGGMDTIEHTMNIINPLNLRTAGLSARDAEILRLGMTFHDVGKQYDPLDHDHPRKSATDAEPLLWQFGLSPKEVHDTLAVIKWHDAYGDALKVGGGAAQAAKIAKLAYEYTDDTLSPDARKAEALRINNLLMRAWQSDLASIPGLTKKPIPGRPDITVSGFIDVDTAGPAFEKAVATEINNLTARPASAPVPKKPATPTVGTAASYLVAPGCEWGEIVQREKDLPIGAQVPYGSTVRPPKEVYDEARKHPELNYARAFNMGYDGPTGQITTIYHGIESYRDTKKIAEAILNTGLRPGSNGNNVFGHGIYAFLNGANEMASNYSADTVLAVELHTGRTIDKYKLENDVVPKWEAANPAQARAMRGSTVYGKLTAAALWAGYSSITMKYHGGEPAIVVLDPARVVIKEVVGSKSSGYKGKTLNTTNHGRVKFNDLTPDEKQTPVTHPEHIPVTRGKPKGWS